MLELENNLPLILAIRLYSIPQYSPAVKGRLLLLLMKKNLTTNQFLSFIFIQCPPAAFPYIIRQLGKIIQMFDQVYIHFCNLLAINTIYN